MKTIQVMGPGCPKCRKLTQLVEQASSGADVECRIEKVTDMDRILEAGVVMTPALVVDGVLRSSGRIPSVDEIRAMIS